MNNTDITAALAEYPARRAVQILRRASRTGDTLWATIDGRRLCAWFGLVREV